MDKLHTQEAVRLTKEALTRYWMLDCEYVLSLCDQDVTWIGAQREQFMIGYDATAEDIRSIMPELKPCTMSNQEFYVAQNCGRACTVMGRYMVTTIPETDVYLQAWQRCVFIWEQKAGELRIKHISVSNAIGELKVVEKEKFPGMVGKISKQLLTNRLKEIQEQKRLVINGDKGIIRFLPLQEICYAKSSGKFIHIYTTTDCFEVRMEMQEFLRQAGEDFVLAHRSYAVNYHYVSEIRRCCLELTDGTVIPVPVKKFMEVKEQLVEKNRS